MTGFGEAHCQQGSLTVAVEVRTVNSRFFKLSVRAGEGYGPLEPKIEAVVRRSIRRGAVQVTLRIHQARPLEDFKINAEVLDRYRRQLETLHRQWNVPGDTYLEALLPLPGVVNEDARASLDLEADWPVIAQTLEAAMESLARMRSEEGRAMEEDLRANRTAIVTALERVQQRAPLVADGYRARLDQRLKNVLTEYGVSLDPADLIREVSLFAERGDISEEIVRLFSHLDQFEATMDLQESSGRTLEFLTQEMFRETNTIGSKGNDVEIARDVIEIKAAIERMREMIQNIE
ncbi:MAG TPA: YicC/YloC family endoribonuclease [Thermoguttaceae bacterium]|nr:YicC/YloC family endoribonuclease [Thermoguttaceae bacterium]